jgi:hypothetical protein
MDTAECTEKETRRGRVRGALMRLGFRFPKGTTDEDAKKRLNRICDDLAYLSDESLRRLVGALRTKGEGSAKCFWPERATFLAFAEAVQSRPLEEAEGVASWFASVAGREALEGDRLVAEFRFWQRLKRPPMSKGDKLTLAQEAAEIRSQRDRARFNRDAGRAPVLDDAEFLRWYEATEARALALVEAGRRGAAA